MDLLSSGVLGLRVAGLRVLRAWGVPGLSACSGHLFFVRGGGALVCILLTFLHYSTESPTH